MYHHETKNIERFQCGHWSSDGGGVRSGCNGQGSRAVERCSTSQLRSTGALLVPYPAALDLPHALVE